MNGGKKGCVHPLRRTGAHTRSGASSARDEKGTRAKKRFNALMAGVLALALSPFGSVMAYATGSDGAPAADNAARAAGDTSVVVDASTMGNWESLVGESTRNVGRIWTDKSVFSSDVEFSGSGTVDAVQKGDSTFVTVLSALSGTSNLKSTATTPLDVVLVLDASGSMSERMGSGSDRTTRIKALQDAANSFIDEIAKQNASISDESKQHQVAIVKFAGDKSDTVGNDRYGGNWFNNWVDEYNYSQTMKAMAPCTSQAKDKFKSQINAINPGGATRADYGFELAAGQSSGRADAKKIIVFFTDGSPTSSSGFEDSTASAAVSKAKEMKDAGASVYSVGIFDGADPSADPSSRWTSNTNKFMQAVSSNYPDATSYTSFGTRAQNADFYKSAANADELKTVFDDISKEIVRDAGYPTDTTSGYEDQSGYIAFTDQLGDYMKVDDFKAIVFADQNFMNPAKQTEGNTDTYTFTGQAGNVLYPEGNLDAISITVTRSTDDKTGDVVEVKIPAGLIPLRHFEIDEEKGTGSVTPTYPIRICYGSSLKEGVADSLANPDDALKAYMDNHADGNKVYFLANTWSGASDGDTVADFTPSRANSYYYITEDTPIYEDEACTQRAKYPLEGKGKTYYYQRTWYSISGASAVKQTGVVSFTGDTLENLNGYVKGNSDGAWAYFEAGTPRMTYINELHDDKVTNETATASSAIDPKWADAADANVNVHLGNNGKLFVEGSGTLSISKTVSVPAGFDAEDYEGKDFAFTLQLPASYAGKTLAGEVKDAQGQKVGDSVSLAFAASAGESETSVPQTAEAAFELKHGQTLYVYGLTKGDAYKVVEAGQPGFTTTAVDDTGVIAESGVTEARFTNSYSAQGTLEGSVHLKGTKYLSGRDWNDTDTFAFLISAKGNAPLPENRVATVTKASVADGGTKASFNFGDITYEKPGTYEYDISEIDEGEGYDGSIVINPGVSVSEALYHVTVTVSDNGNGTLSTTSTMVQLKDDSGARVADSGQDGVDAAAFANVYSVKEAAWNLRGTKTYEDKSGAKPLVKDMFQFELTRLDEGAPMPANATDDKATASVDASGSFGFEQITFGQDDVGKTYRYELREVKPANANLGMTYDESVWDITVAVTSQESGGDAITVVTPSYTKRGDATTQAETASNPTFANTYAPTPADVEGFAAGTKTLVGRDSLVGESFNFALSQVSGPENGVALGASEASVEGLTDGVPKSFDFGTATFSKPGTYVFKIHEIVPQPASSGLTYDTHESTVTVRVVDENGMLNVESISYSDAATAQGGAAFTNTYTVGSQQYAGIVVSKTLDGRTMRQGEFDFAITGVKTDTVSAEDAEARLADADKAFSNSEQKASGIACAMTKLNGITFTSDDIGKTFGYEVSEIMPVAEGSAAAPVVKDGVTYDTNVHQVRISVADNNAGGLAVATTVDDQVAHEVSFLNSYRASDASYSTARADFKKVLEGRDWNDGDSFEFTLKPLNGGPLPKDDGGNEVTTAIVNRENNASAFSFGTIAFTSDDMKIDKTPVTERTFSYEVSEVPGTLEGITYSANKAVLEVHVTDDGAGHLSAVGEAENNVFTNIYREFADNEVPIIASKAIAGNPTEDMTGKFHFVLKALDGGPLPDIVETTNDANGLVDFGRIAFTPSVFEREAVVDEDDAPGTDVPGDIAPGNDDNPGGNVAEEALPNGNPGGNEPGGDSADDNAGKPVSSSASEPADDEGISAQSENPGVSVGESSDDADANVRTFRYSITEQPSGLANITDDVNPTVTFEIEVTCDANGNVSAQVAKVWKDGDATGNPSERVPAKGSSLRTFVNVFELPYVPPTPPVDPDPDPVFASPVAKKVLEGRDLAAGEFAFELVENGRVVAKATNAADGVIAFGAIKYTAAGAHEYTMREVAGDQENVTYDTADYRVSVTVSKQGNKLVAQVSYPDGEPVFTNRYTEPKPDPVPAPDPDPTDPVAPADPDPAVMPKPAEPAPVVEPRQASPARTYARLAKTGDDAALVGAAFAALAAAGAAVFAAYRMSRKRGE